MLPNERLSRLGKCLIEECAQEAGLRRGALATRRPPIVRQAQATARAGSPRRADDENPTSAPAARLAGRQAGKLVCSQRYGGRVGMWDVPVGCGNVAPGKVQQCSQQHRVLRCVAAGSGSRLIGVEHWGWDIGVGAGGDSLEPLVAG